MSPGARLFFLFAVGQPQCVVNASSYEDVQNGCSDSHTQISNKEENVLFVLPWGPGSHSNFETSLLGERVHWLFKINHKSSPGTDCQLMSDVMRVLRARKNEVVDAGRQIIHCVE